MRLRIAFIRYQDVLKVSRPLKTYREGAGPIFFQILECNCRKIQVIGGVLSENFSRIN